MGLLDLFRPKWKHSSPSVRMEAMASVTDQAVLGLAAVSDSDAGVRKAAVEHITDQEWILESIVETHWSGDVRDAAAKRLAELRTLDNVAKAAADAARAARPARATSRERQDHAERFLRCRECGNVQERGAWEEAMNRQAISQGNEGFFNINASPQCLRCGKSTLESSPDAVD